MYLSCSILRFSFDSPSYLRKMLKRKSKAHFMFNILFFWKSCCLWEICRAIYATDNNTARALCMPDNQDYSHTLWTLNYCIPMAQCCIIHPLPLLLDYACTTLHTQWWNGNITAALKTGQDTKVKNQMLTSVHEVGRCTKIHVNT